MLNLTPRQYNSSIDEPLIGIFHAVYTWRLSPSRPYRFWSLCVTASSVGYSNTSSSPPQRANASHKLESLLNGILPGYGFLIIQKSMHTLCDLQMTLHIVGTLLRWYYRGGHKTPNFLTIILSTHSIKLSSHYWARGWKLASSNCIWRWFLSAPCETVVLAFLSVLKRLLSSLESISLDDGLWSPKKVEKKYIFYISLYTNEKINTCFKTWKKRNFFLYKLLVIKKSCKHAEQTK